MRLHFDRFRLHGVHQELCFPRFARRSSERQAVLIANLPSDPADQDATHEACGNTLLPTNRTNKRGRTFVSVKAISILRSPRPLTTSACSTLPYATVPLHTARISPSQHTDRLRLPRTPLERLGSGRGTSSSPSLASLGCSSAHRPR